jgi:N-acetylmuramoyl-L-alanine amidase
VGYELDTLTVTCGDNQTVEVTNNQFTMPAADVTVTATFKAIEFYFVDVPERAWYHDAVYWAVGEGITSGTSPTTFSPNRPCTRAQLVCFLYRLRESTATKRVVVIDPGHQLHANPAKEPNGPGSSVMKAKVSGGTYGPASGVHEYQLNLTVSLMLRTELERRGYRVVMTRTTHDVDLSNVERAKIGNSVHADAVIRIHANGSNDASVHGAYTINMTKNNPWNGNLYTKSRALSEAVLNAFCARTGARKRSIWDTDTMTGINWSTVPVTILEMGYMSNRSEDLAMATAAYQQKMVLGIADGIDDYFGR